MPVKPVFSGEWTGAVSGKSSSHIVTTRKQFNLACGQFVVKFLEGRGNVRRWGLAGVSRYVGMCSGESPASGPVFRSVSAEVRSLSPHTPSITVLYLTASPKQWRQQGLKHGICEPVHALPRLTCFSTAVAHLWV